MKAIICTKYGPPEVCGCEDSLELFLHDFVAVWKKL